MQDDLLLLFVLTQEASKKKMLHEHLRWGVNRTPLPSTFHTIHPIGMIFGTSIKRNNVVFNWFPWQPELHK